MQEIERTYLAGQLPGIVFNSSSKEILDIYIPSVFTHPVLRVRKSGSTYEITKKELVVDGDASRQLETTIPLNAEEFADLEKIPGKRVRKLRYQYEQDGHNFEIDVF